MRSILKRKVYDTEKAYLIGFWEKPDFAIFRGSKECLYRSKKGDYFLTLEVRAIDPQSNKPEIYEGLYPITEFKADEWTRSYLNRSIEECVKEILCNAK